MRGLTIIVAAAEPSRLHAALSVAAAAAALDRNARLFLHAEAVAMMRAPISSPRDRDYAAAGLPTLSELLGEAAGLGVEIVACQSGLPLAGMTATELPAGVRTGGLVELLSSSEDDQLLFV